MKYNPQDLEANWINNKIAKAAPTLPEQFEIMSVSGLLSNDIIKIYHGTKDNNLIPNFKFNNSNNDYGKGFYTTPYSDLGKEWAYASYSRGDEGYLYTYEINIKNLNILNLTTLDTMHWLAELLYNREIESESREALQDTINSVIKKYKIDTSEYDIIIGYRADDSYFTYATDFISGAIYRDTLEGALRNGNLGIQVFIKSEKALGLLKQIGKPEPVDIKYKDLYLKRDKQAREKYQRDKRNQTSRLKQRVFDFI